MSEMERIADRAELFKSEKDGQWYVRTVSTENGKTILRSEGYNHYTDAESVAYDTGLEVKVVDEKGDD